MRSHIGLLAVSLFAVWGSSAEVARADLRACGQVDVRAQAECVIVPPSVDCETMCTPVTVRAACSAKLAVDCDADCSELPSVACSASCEAGCRTDCTVDPGRFECAADCRVDCNGRCEAGCAGRTGNDRETCKASCGGACSTSCDGECDVQLPEVDCNAQCQASCDGSCKVDTNLDCQVDCQADGYARCEADVTGGCVTQCQSQRGALFCDGQFVDTGDKLQECVEALKAVLDAHVMTSGSSECTGNSCKAEGSASVSCSALPGTTSTTPTGALPVLALSLAGVLWRVRRRKR